MHAFSGNVSCTLLCLEHRVGTAAVLFACSIPLHSHKKQHGAEIYHSSFSAEETSSERSNPLPRVHKTWISSDHTVDSTAILRRDQRARDSLQSEAPSSERSQRPLTPRHPPICLGFPNHSTLLALVWANGSGLVPGNYNGNHPQKVLSLFPASWSSGSKRDKERRTI